MKYWKKSKMYRVMKEALSEIKMPKMINCQYKFYRGSEWLEFRYTNEDEYVYGHIYKCYKSGNILIIDTSKYDYERNLTTDVNHQVYAIMPDDSLVLKYDRMKEKMIV